MMRRENTAGKKLRRQEVWREIRKRSGIDHWEFRVVKNPMKPVLRRKKGSEAAPTSPQLGQMHRLEASLLGHKAISTEMIFLFAF